MRWVIGIVVVFATALPGAAQVAPDKNKLLDYQPLKVGTKWTYDVDAGNGQIRQVTNQIAKIELIDGKELARMETVINGTVVASEHLTSTPAGVFRHRYNGIEVRPALCVIKYPFKVGESWEATPSIGPQQMKVTARSVGTKEVTSPAGKFQTIAVHIETEVNGTKIGSTSWYAPGIGVVAQETEIGDKNVGMELAKFEPGK